MDLVTRVYLATAHADLGDLEKARDELAAARACPAADVPRHGLSIDLGELRVDWAGSDPRRRAEFASEAVRKVRAPGSNGNPMWRQGVVLRLLVRYFGADVSDWSAS
jgi:hypothetical protein